jgi:hypothetical protein
VKGLYLVGRCHLIGGRQVSVPYAELFICKERNVYYAWIRKTKKNDGNHAPVGFAKIVRGGRLIPCRLFL